MDDLDASRLACAASDLRETKDIVVGLVDPSTPEAEVNRGVGILQARATLVEFDSAAGLCRSDQAGHRIMGADILGQLGWSRPTFVDQSVEILIAMLRDCHPAVVSAAAVALGHRNSARAIAPALALIQRPEAEVRFGAALALQRHDDSAAISGLIALCRDEDRDVRSWATFGLAQMTDTDSPQLREALLLRTDDADPEVRGEALIGLAKRHDDRVLASLERELTGEFFGVWAVEAAQELRSPSLMAPLKALRRRLAADDEQRFGEDFDAAIAACTPTTPFSAP